MAASPRFRLPPGSTTMRIPATSAPVPLRSIVISLMALAAAVVGNAWPGSAPGSPEVLLWLLALVPAFLLAYHRGWKGVSAALAGGMALIAATEVGLTLAGARDADPLLLSGVVAAFVGAALGAGWLADALHRARMLAERSSLEMVVLLSADGRIRYASPAVETILGTDPASLTGRSIQALVHPDDRDAVGAALRSLAGEASAATQIQVRVGGRDGEWRIVHAVGRNLLDDPAVGGIQVTARDQTERLRNEEHMRQAQKMEELGHLTGGIAHDFNNLLTVILSNVEELDDELTDASHGAREAVRDIGQAAERGAALVARLLSFSRRDTLEPTAVDLGEYLDELESPLQRLLTPRIDVRTIVPDDLPAVCSDPTALEQIFLNLATNAGDAIDGRGRVTIEADAVTLTEDDRVGQPWAVPGRYVRITVQDTGRGMDPQTLERIFEPLFTTKQAGEGTGLGLSVVHGLVKQQGGLIRAYSEVDRGTAFAVYLPVADEEEGPAEGPSAAPGRSKEKEDEPAVPRGSETILLIDDEAALRRAARRTLERLGYTVLCAGSGEDGIRIYEEDPGRVDLVLSDEVMPGMSGADVHRALAEVAPDPAFVLMSGYSAGEAERRIDLPGVPFIQKPWSVASLASEIRDLLDRERRG